MDGHLDATYFPTPAAFRAWLERHHASETALWVGFHKKGTGQPTLTWPESVAEALCFGWIDGVRKGVDEARYAIRFTPRTATSTWSAVNVKLMGELLAAGRVRPAGLAAWERRADARTAIYAYEQRDQARLDAADEQRFREDPAAWAYWETCPPGYRRQMVYRVVSAKRPETRAKRLGELMAACAAGRRLG